MPVSVMPPEEPAAGSTALQRQVELLQGELVQARQALEDLNYAISHDLRAPLRHVRAYLQIVEEDFGASLAPALRNHLRTVEESAAQMARMVDALLELSRLRQSSMQPSMVDLSQLVQQAREEAESMEGAVARAAPLQWMLGGDVPALHADPELLLQVMRRLFSNALKFTRGQAGPCVQVQWSCLAGARGAGAATFAPATSCEIRIRDNGAGFDMRQAEGLGKPFQRLHAARDYEGLGAGLAYVQLAMQRMGGTMQIRSEGPRQGCEVVLRLPGPPGGG